MAGLHRSPGEDPQVWLDRLVDMKARNAVRKDDEVVYKTNVSIAREYVERISRERKKQDEMSDS